MDLVERVRSWTTTFTSFIYKTNGTSQLLGTILTSIEFAIAFNGKHGTLKIVELVQEILIDANKTSLHNSNPHTHTHTHTHTLTHLVNVYTKLGDENNSHIDTLYLNIIK